MAGAHFSPALFRFLQDLADHNDRDWFDANRHRYEEDVREPALRFILAFGPRLKEISPHFRADPRKQGGSLFRIHRNLRFQPDAPPYKTHTGIQFRHEAGRDAHAPGFYLHLEPGGCFVGVGTWRPDSTTLKVIREAIVADPDG
ncbi:MAG TPA: TIGR02453 family protein, partial [Longimicrobiales bacterium]|nr:TIGR02453 family protein [Longimicrobiales bacterium]